MKRIGAIICFVCLCSTFFHAQSVRWEVATKQEVKAAYQTACNWFVNTPSYYFKLKYVSFKDYLTNEPQESSVGYYKRVENNYITEAVGIKTLQNSSMKFVIDSSSKIVTVMSPSSLNLAIANSENLETMLDNVKELKKNRTNKDVFRYHIDFNKNDLCEAYEFMIDEKGLLKSLTYFYSERDNNEDTRNGKEKPAATKIKPRLEITFFDLQVPAKYSKSEFEESAIILNEKGKISLSGVYKNYRLLDYRLQNDK